MTDPTTLGEVLDKWEGKGRATCGQTGGAIHDFTQDLRRILYGTDEPCPECDHGAIYGSPPEWTGARVPIAECPTCHGGCRDKTPGLVERLGVAAEHTQVPGWPERTYYLLDPTSREFSAWRSALRREIGEV